MRPVDSDVVSSIQRHAAMTWAQRLKRVFNIDFNCFFHATMKRKSPPFTGYASIDTITHSWLEALPGQLQSHILKTRPCVDMIDIQEVCLTQ